MKQYPVDTCEKFSYQLMEAYHICNNVQLYDKCENELKDWCWDTDHMFPGQEYECLDIWHNSEIHIFSVATHDLNVDMHTLLTFPCHMLWLKHNTHME